MTVSRSLAPKMPKPRARGKTPPKMTPPRMPKPTPGSTRKAVKKT